MSLAADPQLAAALRRLAQLAADAILDVYQTPFEARSKQDRSPVTDADEAAERIIVAGLKALTPDIPIVAEEATARGETPERVGTRFWLVDPLDGTREFVKRNGEFTVNIALIENGEARLGVVLCPVGGLSYLGSPAGAWRYQGNDDFTGARIQARRAPPDGADAMVSRSHPEAAAEAWLSSQKIRSRLEAGSSLKFCRIAEGLADVYPRMARIREWDTAAGQAVLEAAGGSVRDLQGSRLLYGKPDYRNPEFIARGRD